MHRFVARVTFRQAAAASRQRISFVLSDVQRRSGAVGGEEPPPPPQQSSPDDVAVAAAVDQYQPPQPRQPAPYPHQPAHAHAHAPPALPRSRGPTPCAWSLACLGATSCLGFCALLLVELPWVTLEGSAVLLQQRRLHAQTMRRQQQLHGSAAPPRVRLGLWDEHGVISPLQLNVILSLATGVEEQHVHVTDRGEHFFDVDVDGEGAWLIDAVNAPGGAFAHTLNQQAATFGARMVVSHAAAEADGDTATAAATNTGLLSVSP